MSSRHSMSRILRWLTASLRSQAVPTILMYHSTKPGLKLFFNVAPDEFRWQMETLSAAGLRFVTLDDIARYIRGEIQLPNATVCMTFDDGYKDNIDYALPVLEKFGIPATIYFVPEFATKGGGAFGLACCDRQEIIALSQHPLLTVGSHTSHHYNLPELSSEQAAAEITHGKETLESWLGKPVKHFAYPRGKYDSRMPALVRAAGIETAVTVVPSQIRPGCDPFLLGRVPVDQGLPRWLFKQCNKQGIVDYHNIRRRFQDLKTSNNLPLIAGTSVETR